MNKYQGRTPVAWGGREHAETRVDGRAPKQATRNGSGKATGLHVNNRVKQAIGNGQEATPWAGITSLGLQRGRSGPLVDTRTAHTNYKPLINQRANTDPTWTTSTTARGQANGTLARQTKPRQRRGRP